MKNTNRWLIGILVVIIGLFLTLMIAYVSLTPVVTCFSPAEIVDSKEGLVIVCCEDEGETAYITINLDSTEASFSSNGSKIMKVNLNQRYYINGGPSFREGCDQVSFQIENIKNLSGNFTVNMERKVKFIFIPPFNKFKLPQKCFMYELNESSNYWIRKSC